MDQSNNASVALLMLDIASAKSTLAQLQHTFSTAATEHQRTLHELDTLKRDCGASPLYVKGSTVAHKVLAQQLQALHTENIQLKALLKQEISMRQELEHQHAGLLQQLRNFGIDDLLLTRSSQCQDSNDQASQHMLTAAAASNMEAKHLLKDQAPADAFADFNTTNIASITPAAAITVQPPTRSSDADNEEPNKHLAEVPNSIDQSMYQHNRHSHSKSPDPAVFAPSAYFPSQWQEPVVTLNKQAMPVSRQHAKVAPQQPTIKQVRQASSGGVTSPSHPQGHPAPSHNAASTGFQQPNAHWQPTGFVEHDVTASDEQLDNSDNCCLHSSSSSSSQTAASELLDSEDLEELAGLCDGLISEASKQRLASMAASEPGFGPSCRLHSTTAPAESESRHTPQQSAAVKTPYSDHVMQDSGVTAERVTQQSQPAVSKRQHKPSAATSVEVLAAELQRLQQQAASVGIDTGAAVAAVNAALGALHSRDTTSGDNVNVYGLPPDARAHGVGSDTDSGTGDGDSSNGNSQTSAETAFRPAAGAAGTKGSDMARLQQQLAARMAEVKQRLSSICNMRLEAARSMGVAEDNGASGYAPEPFAAGQLGQAMDAFRKQPSKVGAAVGSKQTTSSTYNSSNQAAGSGSSQPTSSAPAAASVLHHMYSPTLQAETSRGSPVAHYTRSSAASGGALNSDAEVSMHGPAGSGRPRVNRNVLLHTAKQAIAATTATSAADPMQGVAHSTEGNKGAESDSDSSWDTVDDEQAQHPRDELHDSVLQQQHQQRANLHYSHWRSATLGQDTVQHSVYQTLTKQQQNSEVLHQHGTAQQPPVSDKLHRALHQRYVASVAEQGLGVWPAACMAERIPADADSSSPTDALVDDHDGTEGAWQLPQQMQASATENLEGVLFGLKGRVAAEVSQTLSPLKAVSGSGSVYVRPGSPVTPLRPKNVY